MATVTSSSAGVDVVVVHPLVLLSVTDHYHRVAKDTKKRVVGILLGELSKGRLDVTNAYAVPFEEDDKDGAVWFLDHSYHEQMYHMHRRINAKEVVVGWYSTGPKLRGGDLNIHELVSNYCANPVLVIVDVEPKEIGLPTNAYAAVDLVAEGGSQQARKTFVHVPSEVGAYEAEEIGVEHLLRDVKDATVSTLATRVDDKLQALKGLEERLADVASYLDHVVAGRLPVNQEILAHLQNVFNLLPNLNVPDVVRSFAVKTNDALAVVYVSSLIRTVLALHNLITNKVTNRQRERERDARAAADDAAKNAKDEKSDPDAPAEKEGTNVKPSS